ncbi:MAG: 2-hydroxyacyl-CoA dehydratase [Bacteroidota bacterium]
MMKNFEKSEIIREAAFNKNEAKFLSRDEQMRLNSQMREKLMRFVNEMTSEENRPAAMKLFDRMMNEMHGKRIKDLYAYRREGNHVVTLLCNSIPPEIIYAMGSFIPVSVCMGAGEVEPYAGEETKDMCSITRSMTGFLKTGMCVFFNLADHVLASDLCPNVKKVSDIVREYSDEFEVYCLETHKDEQGEISIDSPGFRNWVDRVTEGKGFEVERLVEYAKLYSEIRKNYRAVLDTRKNLNPPLNGKNSVWIQQVALVEEPHKLLESLKQLYAELIQNVETNIGYDPYGTQKRVMLISPRIMPPFAEVYRVIEACHAVVVCEETDMGITNIEYPIDDVIEMSRQAKPDVEEMVKYIAESLDKTSSSCIEAFDPIKILNKVEDFHVDAVVAFSFDKCRIMEEKTKNICQMLMNNGIDAMTLNAGYIEMYQNEYAYKDMIKRFLMT